MLQLFFLFIITLLPLAQPCWASQSKLRIVTEQWPPMSYEQNGSAEGMAVDLTRMILKSTTLSQKIEVLPWPRAYHLATTQPNVLLFTVARSVEREKLFTMIGPIAKGEISIFLRENYDRKKVTLEYLKNNMSIATHRGTAFQDNLKKEGFLKIIPVNSSISAVKMLMSGRADAVCDDDIAINELFLQAGYEPKQFSKYMGLTHSSFYFAFSKGTDWQTIATWKTAFEQLKKNGEFKLLYKKWFPHLKAPPGVDISIPTPQPNISVAEETVKYPDVSELLKFQLPKGMNESRSKGL